MDFQGPTPADYENLRSLNLAFLKLMRQNGRKYSEGLSPDLNRRLRGLSLREIDWLAASPFLLFSLRERDDGLWRRMLGDDTGHDLFATSQNPTNDVGRLVCAGLGFVWQLANRNPFAARLLCGASVHWCEQITERTFFHILTVAGHRSDLLVLRAQHDAQLWKKLLIVGLSEEAESRNAAHVSALQHILTGQPAALTWQAAACASRSPALKVAEDPEEHSQ